MEKTYPVYTLKNECNDCYKCIRDCHVKAIRIHGGSASVINERWIACGHCVTICPVGAISFQEDAEGFNYPLIDASKCTNCGLCEKTCPFKKKKYKSCINH